MPSGCACNIGVVAGETILLECWETKSFTFPIGDVSALVGEDWPGGMKCMRGGDRGDSTFTDGVNCGDDCITIDIGRLWPDFGGDELRPRSRTGVLGDETLLCAHGEVGRGRSKDARTVGAAPSGSSRCSAEGDRRGLVAPERDC